jgi:hypothetical protein
MQTIQFPSIGLSEDMIEVLITSDVVERTSIVLVM